MASAVEKESKKETAEKTEYFELRIPKVSNGQVPIIITVFLMFLSFLAGVITMRMYSEYNKSAVVTSATGAFNSYAKQLKLDTKQFSQCLDDKKYADAVTTDIDNGNSFTVSATPTFFINGRMLVGAQPYELFQQMIDQEISGNRSPLTPEEASGSAQVAIAKGHLPVLGSNDAKVTIVEFSDFQCPFCESFYTSTYPELKKNYIDTGKVNMTFRHYPLTSIHPSAETAHRASECANEQGKFWEYHDLLFQMQPDWAELPLVDTPTT